MSANVEALFAEHGPAVLGYLIRRVEVSEDAADLLSEVITVAWRRRKDIPGAPADRPWLFGVARNVLANHHRSLRRRDRLVKALGQAISESVPPATDSSLAIRIALAELDPIDREIVTLSAWEGMSSGEIALAVDIPASTVRARLTKTREQLREILYLPS